MLLSFNIYTGRGGGEEEERVNIEFGSVNYRDIYVMCV